MDKKLQADETKFHRKSTILKDYGKVPYLKTACLLDLPNNIMRLD